jgi:hypothetical protein
VKQGKGKGGRKEKEGPRCGVTVSAVAGRKKRRKKWRATAGEDVGSVGRCGLKGKEVRFSLFLFSFPFSNSFQIKPFQLKFKQNFSNFFTKFYKPFRPHTSNQKPCISK